MGWAVLGWFGFGIFEGWVQFGIGLVAVRFVGVVAQGCGWVGVGKGVLMRMD